MVLDELALLRGVFPRSGTTCPISIMPAAALKAGCHAETCKIMKSDGNVYYTLASLEGNSIRLGGDRCKGSELVVHELCGVSKHIFIGRNVLECLNLE